MKGTVCPYHSGYIRHPYGKKTSRSLHIHSKITTGREIDKEVVDGLFHPEKVGYISRLLS